MMQEPRITGLKVTKGAIHKGAIHAELADGRTVSVPLAWSWRLANAKPAQLKRFEIIGNGEGIHWPELDEDLSAWGLLHGTPAR